MVFKRVGFACKYMDLNQEQSKKILKETQQNYSEKTTTIKGSVAKSGSVAKIFLEHARSYFGRVYAASPKNCSKID